MRQSVLEKNKELVAKARSLIPNLRERGEETEKYNRIPETTINELKENGLLKVFCMYGYPSEQDKVEGADNSA